MGLFFIIIILSISELVGVDLSDGLLFVFCPVFSTRGSWLRTLRLPVAVDRRRRL
jgi:hypothetical protein